MVWIFLVLAVLCFFIYQGFRLRCPLCGEYAVHQKDTTKEDEAKVHYEKLKQTGMLDSLDKINNPLGSARSKPGYANANFSCNKCVHSFSRREAIIWSKTSAKLGDKVAIHEYQKLIQNR